MSKLISNELRFCEEMIAAGVESNMVQAMETCIRYSGEGPFTPREVEIMRELAEDEDEIAQAMEDALQGGKGKPYRTRYSHGAVLAGQNYRVWRTKSMTIAVPRASGAMAPSTEP